MAMTYYVEVHKNYTYKRIVCDSLEGAMRAARIAAYMLDIKIKQNLPKKEWNKWSAMDCYFSYSLTSDTYKDGAKRPAVVIRSCLIPNNLWGKNIKQVEKALANAGK